MIQALNLDFNLSKAATLRLNQDIDNYCMTVCHLIKNICAIEDFILTTNHQTINIGERLFQLGQQ